MNKLEQERTEIAETLKSWFAIFNISHISAVTYDIQNQIAHARIEELTNLLPKKPYAAVPKEAIARRIKQLKEEYEPYEV